MLRSRVRASILSMVIVFSLLLTPIVFATPAPAIQKEGITDGPAPSARTSHRLIVELELPSLSAWANAALAFKPSGKLDVESAAAQSHLAQIEAEQAAFVAALRTALPQANVATYINELGVEVKAAYQVVMNGMVVDPGSADPDQAARSLKRMSGVKNVYRDYAHTPQMYASLPLIDAPAMWTALGGQSASGEGIIVASIDTGVYAPNKFFDPTGYTYPAGYPVGNAAYTTEKVIGARAYFRPWDPPTAGDDGPLPGPNGSSHGTHTIGTVAGNAGTMAEVAGLEIEISGVAPKAQILSYKIGYPTASEFSGSAFTAEIIMAYEDAVADGADVINYSFGGYSGVMPWADGVAIARDAAWDAGVFVSHSAGNEGPGYGSTTDATPKVIEVGASTTTSSVAAGFIDVTSPAPVPDENKGFPFGDCTFCPPVPIGTTYGPYTYTDVATVTDGGTNTLCDGEAITGDLTGQIALISRGGCYFSDKVWNAQEAGAVAAIIYNNDGDELINMSSGSHETDEFTIPGGFIGQTHGDSMVSWKTANPTAEAQFDFTGRQIDTNPDVMAGFSSRGPAYARYLEPDVTAPGASILSAGYAPGASGVDRHAGFGSAGGTSMAAPHVAGAAALIKQLHPTWSNDQIKSALMSTAETIMWLDSDQTVPATVRDMGAGRIDLGEAGDAALTFDYPSLSFPGMHAGDVMSMTVEATDVTGATDIYALTVTDELSITLSVSTPNLQVEANDGEPFVVTVEVAPDALPGDYGGFVWLTSATERLHIPVWVRVEAPMATAKVLLVDNDFSDLVGYPDYTYYYTSTLESLGVDYDYYPADWFFANPQTLPDPAELAAYDVIIYYSGDNYDPDGTYTVSTPLTVIDMQVLSDWQFNGGRLLVTGQDVASAWDALSSDGSGYFIYAGNLGTAYLQDSLFDPGYAGLLPTSPSLMGVPGTPLSGMLLDLSGAGDGAANQYYVDEVEIAPYGDTEAPDSINPLLSAVGGSPVDQGYVASARADSPTLEMAVPRYDYRTIYLSFGFEGINNDTGFTTREELMGGLLDWLTDDLEVTLEPASGVPQSLTTLTAVFTSSVESEAVQYRWDFGDGSEYATTSGPSVVHAYDEPGIYEARVEVTDANGHKVVSDPAQVVVNLTITKDVEPFFQAPGETVTYTIVFENMSEEAVSGVTVSDTLPAEVVYVSSNPPGAYDPGTHDLVWAGLDLDPLQRIEATVVGTIGAGVTEGTWVTNTVYLFYGGLDPIMDEAVHVASPERARYYLPIVGKAD